MGFICPSCYSDKSSYGYTYAHSVEELDIQVLLNTALHLLLPSRLPLLLLLDQQQMRESIPALQHSSCMLLRMRLIENIVPTHTLLRK